MSNFWSRLVEAGLVDEATAEQVVHPIRPGTVFVRRFDTEAEAREAMRQLRRLFAGEIDGEA
jgi:hypothetical protein